MVDGAPRSWASYVLGMRRIQRIRAVDNLRMHRAFSMGNGFTRKKDREDWVREQQMIAGG